MAGFEMSTYYWWLIAGAIFMALEAFGIPSIGFLFAGLAALLVGILVFANLVPADSLFAQFALFFVFTGIFVALMWKKLQLWRTSPATAGNYNNMVGDSVVIAAGGLAKGKVGKASWSGTTMIAQLAADATVTHLDEGDHAVIVEVVGNKLIVAPESTTN